MPAASDRLCDFADALQEEGRKPATILRKLASVRRIHKMLRLPFPSSAPALRQKLKQLRGERNAQGSRAGGLRLSGANSTPLTFGALIAACGDDLLGLRDAALLATSYAVGLRAADLALLCVEHFSLTADGTGRLMLPAATGEVPQVLLLEAGIARHIQSWIDVAALGDGPLFRRVAVNRRKARPAQAARTIADLAPNAKIDHGRMAARPAEPARVEYLVGEKPLTPHGATHILRRVAAIALAEAGQDEKVIAALLPSLSLHALRVGLAQDRLAAGEGEGSVARALRLRTEASVRRYAQSLPLPNE